MSETTFTKRERGHLKTIQSRLKCLRVRIGMPKTPTTVDYIAEEKALDWLLESLNNAARLQSEIQSLTTDRNLEKRRRKNAEKRQERLQVERDEFLRKGE
ncbi:MAG TPA: hypothetical protein VGD05_07060 [Pyrinomonadaceae bacterium]